MPSYPSICGTELHPQRETRLLVLPHSHQEMNCSAPLLSHKETSWEVPLDIPLLRLLALLQQRNTAMVLDVGLTDLDISFLLNVVFRP